VGWSELQVTCSTVELTVHSNYQKLVKINTKEVEHLYYALPLLTYSLTSLTKGPAALTASINFISETPSV